MLLAPALPRRNADSGSRKVPYTDLSNPDGLVVPSNYWYALK